MCFCPVVPAQHIANIRATPAIQPHTPTNGTMHETVTVGFQSVRPAESLQRAVEFTRIACADIARVQVSDADRCQMGDLNKFSPANGQCLARLRIAPSTSIKFDK